MGGSIYPLGLLKNQNLILFNWCFIAIYFSKKTIRLMHFYVELLALLSAVQMLHTDVRSCLILPSSSHQHTKGQKSRFLLNNDMHDTHLQKL